MTTAADLINETEDHLLSGDRDQMNRLPNSITPSDITFALEFELTGAQPGAYIAIDLEMMYVWSVNNTTKQVTVQRQMLGSTAASHTAGTVVYVNPKFSRKKIFDALNQEIVDLSAPPNGLYTIKTFTLTTFPVQKTYAVPLVNADLQDIYEIRYQPPGAEYLWPRVWRKDWQLIKGLDPADDEHGIGGAPAGMLIRIERALYPGRHMQVRYKAVFSPLTALTDNVVTVTGLPATAVDIPPLGAAARLMGVREAKRNFVDAEGDSRRAQEVPSGGAARAAQTIQAILNGRIRTETMRLLRAYPELV